MRDAPPPSKDVTRSLDCIFLHANASMERITAALSKIGLAVHSHAEARDHDEHARNVSKDGQVVAKTTLLRDKKGRVYLAIHHPNTGISTKILSTRLGCGKGGLAEASGPLTREVFGSSSVITLGCVLECTHAVGILLDQELRSEFWVGAANGAAAGSIFLDGVHVSQLLEDRALETIDFAASPKIDRDNPPDLKAFADALEPLPKDVLERAQEQAEKEAARETLEGTSKKKRANAAGNDKMGADGHRRVLDVNTLTADLIKQVLAAPAGDVEAQRRVKLDVASRLNQLRNAAYAAGFAAKC